MIIKTSKPLLIILFFVLSNPLQVVISQNDLTGDSLSINENLPVNLGLSYSFTYKTFPEIEQYLTDIVNLYPDITRLFSLGKSYQGRDVWCVEISDNPGVDEGEPGVLYVGLHHGKEWPTTEICLYTIYNLTINYEQNNMIKDLVDGRRIWVIPCLNPDGYAFSHDEPIQHEWRKNRRYLPEYSTYGIDLNRNYGGSSNGDIQGEWGSIGLSMSAHQPLYETYVGPSSFSELETQYIKELIKEEHICTSISWHTYGELVMWPWAYTSDIQTADHQYLEEIGSEIASLITTQHQDGTYVPMQAAEYYTTVGDYGDWTYGYSHYLLGRTHFPFTIEACSEFHPDENFLPQICHENYDGAFYLLTEATTIASISTPVPAPTLDSTVQTDTEFILTWDIGEDQSPPLYYQVEELNNYSTIPDGGDSLSTLWFNQGFSYDPTRGHDLLGCYHADNSNGQTTSLTTNYPLLLNLSSTVSFWLQYDLSLIHI